MLVHVDVVRTDAQFRFKSGSAKGHSWTNSLAVHQKACQSLGKPQAGR
jgi:hypothetical protein